MSILEPQRERWLTHWIQAEMWWCGDEICDCYQPVIEKITPNLKAGYPWINRDRIDEGEFCSQPEPDEWKKMKKWLETAKIRYNIPKNGCRRKE